MRSSYTTNGLNYGDLIRAITYTQKPKTIVEIGILDGYSLAHLANGSGPNTKILAYDIFDEFNGNSGNMTELKDKFRGDPRISIEYGNFYELNNIIPGNVDIIHVDIANDGNVYQYAVNNYTNLLSRGGMLLMEGGSPERDEVDWMHRYTKRPIHPYLQERPGALTLGTVPSITIIKD